MDITESHQNDCPNCGKKTPHGLLRHIYKSLKEYQRRFDSPYSDKPDWLEKTIEKWQSWADWVEQKIKEEENG